MSIQEIFQAVLVFDEARVKEMVAAEIAAGTAVEEILNQGLIAAMDEVGEKFSCGDLFVPEMLMAAQAMQAGLKILKPHLTDESAKSKGTVVIGTVKGDLHDIGKNLVAMMMEGAGFTVIDLGVDVAPEGFLEAARKNNAKVVALSALLTTTMPFMEATIKVLAEAGLGVKTIVGGAPVTAEYADTIGAAGYSDDAPGAVLLTRELMACS
jgi:5-methyltetrahydrofolate--homocysteine methyltransferase